jgi:carboxypeptidase T
VALIFSARARRVVALTLFVAAVAMSNAAASRAATPDFPAGYTAYHTYDEMVADVDSVVAAHPDIARKFSIGKSYEGLDLWAVKVSDNVNVDEDEPEVLFDANIHAREHITAEMNLYILHLLTDRYGKDTQVTQLVNSREIYLIMMLNPDGAMYDISGGKFHKWRKNRQPNAGSPYVGTDLNRNFGWSWGCCNGSSGYPRSIEYRGPFAWSSPEDTAYRDFVRSRVVGGVQQIKIAVSWHSFGQVILWPYGYTMTNVPNTMLADDHKTLVALADGAAALNGYHPPASTAAPCSTWWAWPIVPSARLAWAPSTADRTPWSARSAWEDEPYRSESNSRQTHRIRWYRTCTRARVARTVRRFSL